jgi:hypothetical protein
MKLQMEVAFRKMLCMPFSYFKKECKAIYFYK